METQMARGRRMDAVKASFNGCKLGRFICVKATAAGDDRIRFNRPVDLIEIAFSWRDHTDGRRRLRLSPVECSIAPRPGNDSKSSLI